MGDGALTTGYARRQLLCGLAGAASALSIPGQEASAETTPRTGLVSIFDFLPAHLHTAILAAGDTTDLTEFVQRAFDSGARLWAPAEARFHVRRVTIAGIGRFFDLNNALFVGIASDPTSAVVELKCAHSEIRGLRVAVNRSLAYRAAIHYFTDDVGRRPAGYNRFLGGQADGAAIGLLIGGLPEQRRFLTGRDPTGLAVDAPVSESTFLQWNFTGCIRGVYMNQPNGKLQFIGCHLAGETADWTAASTPRANAAAIVIANDGSEIGVIGGSVEQLQEPSGRFVEVVGGSLTITGATIETTCSSFLAGKARLTLDQLANGGFNSMKVPFVQARADCTGILTMTRFALVMPPVNSVSGAGDLVSCVESFGGRTVAAPGFLVDLANVELREARWSGGGDKLFPLVRGAPLRMRQCRLTRYTSDNLTRLSAATMDDREDRLAGVIDRSAATLPPFGARRAGKAGGWQMFSSHGGRWGRVINGRGRTALRMATDAALSATSPAFPIDRDRLFVLRLAYRFEQAGRITFRVVWLDHTAAEVGHSILFDGRPDSTVGTEPLWIALQAIPPVAAERAMIVIKVADGADLTLMDPSVN